MYKTVVLKNVYLLFHGASLLFSFHLQIAYRKVRDLLIGIDKLVEKVLINLLAHSNIISIIRDAPAIVYTHS